MTKDKRQNSLPKWVQETLSELERQRNEAIKTLPKWAQETLSKLERERNEAVEILEKFLDNQTPSHIVISESCQAGQKGGPFINRFIQGHRVSFVYEGVTLNVLLKDKQINLSWGQSTPGHFYPNTNEVAFIPTGHQQARLVTKENMLK